jgi:hypothetical protein
LFASARANHAARLIVGRALGAQLIAFEFETDPCGNRRLQRAFRSFDFELLLVNVTETPFRHRDYFFSNSRHMLFPIFNFRFPICLLINFSEPNGNRQLAIGNVNKSAPTTRRRCFRACALPLIKPFEVETMLMP